MALSIRDIFSPATADEWMAKILDVGQQVQLPVTSWQSGGITRTILRVMSHALGFADYVVSLIAQGGFLDFAAFGTASYTDSTGKTTTSPVTPEGGPGALDALAQSLYRITRLQAGYAGGVLAILNTSGSTYGPFLAGTYHVSNPTTKVGYSSTTSVTIAPSSVAASISGATGVGGGPIVITTSAAHGLSSGDYVVVTGVSGIPTLAGATSWLVQVVTSTSLILVGSVFAGSYAGGGTIYEPTVTTVRADVVGTGGNSLGPSGVAGANTVTQAVTALVGVTVSNPVVYLGQDVETNLALHDRCALKLQSISVDGPHGAYQFFALTAQTFAALMAPPLTLAGSITRVVVVTEPSSGSVYIFVANPAGAPSADDVAVVDAVEQAYATPDGVTSKTLAALNRGIAAVLTVYLPRAYATAATSALCAAALQEYFASLPVGGVSDPSGSYTRIVPRERALGAIFDRLDEAKIPVQNATLTLDGRTADVQLVVSTTLEVAQVAVLSPAAPTVNLVGI